VALCKITTALFVVVQMSVWSDIQSYCENAVLYADIDGYRVTNTPLATILPSIISTSYHPDIAMSNVIRLNYVMQPAAEYRRTDSYHTGRTDCSSCAKCAGIQSGPQAL